MLLTSDKMATDSSLALRYLLPEPIKIVNDFSKKHDKLVMKIGIVDGKVTELDELKKLATIPSRDGLLTMLAGSMIGIVRDLSICLDLYSKEQENN